MSVVSIASGTDTNVVTDFAYNIRYAWFKSCSSLKYVIEL